MSPLEVLACCFGISALASIAALLMSDKTLTIRLIIATPTYSGTLGLVLGLLWFDTYAKTSPTFMLGAAGLCGLGGFKVADLVMIAIKKSGITFKIVKDKDEGGG